MEELEMIKAFAKLEGLNLINHSGTTYRDLGSDETFTRLDNYNLLTDSDLIFKAMVKYKVQKITEVYNGVEFNIFHIGGESRVSVSDNNLIPKAIIHCILKSEGVDKDKDNDLIRIAKGVKFDIQSIYEERGGFWIVENQAGFIDIRVSPCGWENFKCSFYYKDVLDEQNRLNSTVK